MRAMCGRARLEVGAVDGGEAVAAGVDEEALEAGDAGEGEGFEVALVAVDGAAPEGVVDHALRGAVGAAGGAASRLSSRAATLVVSGRQFSGMSTRVVKPPAAAARVAVAKPSHSVRPGSLMWVWASTRPGSRARLPRSSMGMCEWVARRKRWDGLR